MTQETLDKYSGGENRLDAFLGDLSAIPTNMEFEFETDLPLPVGPLQCPYCWNESRINDYLIPKKNTMILQLGH